MGRANHKKVQEYSDDLKKMIAQGLEKRKKATEVIASTRNEIKNARQLGIDTTKAENLLSAGEKILENAQEIKYYDEAIKNAVDANKIVQELKIAFASAQNVITTARENIAEIAGRGIVVARQQKMVKEAELAFGGHNYGTAKELANTSIKESKGIESQFQSLEKLTGLVSSTIADAKSTEANITKAEEIANKIATLKGNGEYERAITLSKKLVESIKAIKGNYLKATELIGQAEAKINNAKNFQADTSEAEKSYDEATAKMEEHEYKTAIAAAMQCIDSAENVKVLQITNYQNQASEHISELTRDISETEKIGANVSKPVRILNQVKSAIENLEFNSAFDNIEICKNSIDESKSRHQNALGKLNAAKKHLSEVKKIGANVEKVERIILKAEEALKNYDYGTVEELSKASIEESKGVGSQFQTLENLIGVVNSTIADARTTKANLTEAEKMTDKITILKGNGEYDQAITLSKKLVGSVKATKENYLKAAELIGQAEAKINDAKSYDAYTSEAEKLYDEAATKMEEDEYETAIAVALESIEAAENVKNAQITHLQTRASKKISGLTNDISAAEKIGADTGKPISILNQIRSALENLEFNSTFNNIELCKNAVSESKNKHQNALDNLNSTKATIAESKKFGADINKAEQIISKAEEALKNFDYGIVETQITLAKDEAERARERRRQYLGLKEQTEDIIKTSRATMGELKDNGIIAQAAEGLLSSAETSFSNSEFQQAQEHANNAIRTCKDVQKVFTEASASQQKAQTSISNSKILIDTTEARQLYEQCRLKMDEGNYSEALTLAIESMENIEAIKTNNVPKVTIKSQEIPTFKSGSWAKWELEVNNESKVHANEISLKIADDIESRGFMTISNLRAGMKKDLEIGLRTGETGEIPVNVEINFTNPVTDEQLSSQQILWVKTEPGGLGPKFDPDKSSRGDAREPGAEGQVKVLSEVELFQGFIRLKVGIKNEFDTVITDAKLDLEFDDDAIRFDHIEPTLERKANKILFGNINPKEKRTVAFYLDPLICTESHIDGTLSYKNIWGELKNSYMKRRRAEVVCPILYTPENINTAMLKRLIDEELTIHDSKVYEIPYGLDLKTVSKICKETIQGHDLKFVREFIESDINDPEIESWYYGTTKVKKNRMVIKASIRKNINTIELFVACSDTKVLTGFLAELGHNFNNKLQESGLINTQIYPITDTKKRKEINQTSTLLSHQVLDKNTLSLSKRGDEYEVGFKATEEKHDAAEVFEFIKVSPDSRKDMIAQIDQLVTVTNIFYRARGKVGDMGESALEAEVEKRLAEVGVDKNKKSIAEDSIENLSSMGQLLFSMFLPVSIQQFLENINEPLILKTNDNEIPWELLHDSNDFICLKVPIGRRFRSREISRVNPPVESDRTRILFVANPTGDLKAAEKEVDYIRSNLSQDIEVNILQREEATNSAILGALRGGKYDIIHYAGHADFNLISPDESALIGANNSRIIAQEIKRILGGKPFVFLNACGSGKEKICEDGTNYSGSDTEGLASSFILGGALAFIGASWPTPDISAGILASEFYKKFLTGETVGEALRKARIHLRTEQPDDINWMAFVLYGDPTLRLGRNIIA